MTKASQKIQFTPEEWRACLALSMLYGLRMLGLFLVFPILAAEAQHLEGGGDPLWVGIAVGVYGLTQALFQIPFGIASDQYGRRRVILAGLTVFPWRHPLNGCQLVVHFRVRGQSPQR
jgi:MFS family permease